MQVKRALEAQVPGMEVVGSNYPPSPPKAALAKLVFAAQMLFIGLTLAGHQLYPVPPPWLKTLQENKVQSCMLAWFAGNTIAQNLATTGAFEVFYDGAIVFSKLQTGRAPELGVVVRDVIAAHNARLRALA